jgi:hypothetical protein
VKLPLVGTGLATADVGPGSRHGIIRAGRNKEAAGCADGSGLDLDWWLQRKRRHTGNWIEGEVP